MLHHTEAVSALLTGICKLQEDADVSGDGDSSGDLLTLR